jgi:DNA-binding CsgD family transcriptional regulator
MTKLSKKEHEVLIHLADGLQYKEIAVKMYLSFSGAKFHGLNLYRKLNAHNSAHAVAIGFREGLL